MSPESLVRVRSMCCLAAAVLFGGTPCPIAAGDALAAGGPGEGDEPESRRPNVIVFLSDDHRADLLGCAGHPVIKTPTVDRLAAEGTRFENAFVTTSICAASRASILTGQVERTHGYTFGKRPLSLAQVRSTYPAILKAAGYRTGFVGKFGVAVGEKRKGRPAASAEAQELMFDSYERLMRSPYWKTVDGERVHLTNLIGRRAAAFLETAPADRPYCLSVS